MTRIRDLPANATPLEDADLLEGERADGTSEKWEVGQLIGWVDYSDRQPTMEPNFTLNSFSCFFDGRNIWMSISYADVNGRNSSGTGDIGNTTIANLHPDILALAGSVQVIWTGTSETSGRLAAHSCSTSSGQIRRNAVSSGDPIGAGNFMSAAGMSPWKVEAA